jgi:hypothetical protein
LVAELVPTDFGGHGHENTNQKTLVHRTVDHWIAFDGFLSESLDIIDEVILPV